MKWLRIKVRLLHPDFSNMVSRGNTYQVILICFLIWQYGYSQNQEFKNTIKAYEEKAYAKTILEFEKETKKANPTPELFEILGESYYWNSNYAKAAYWYEKWFAQTPNYTNKESIYRYSNSLRSSGNTSKADEVIQLFLKEVSNEDLRKTQYQSYTDLKTTFGDPYETFQVKREAFNSRGMEFAPMFYDSLLLFSSSPRKVRKRFLRDSWSNLGFNDLYIINPNDAKAIPKPFVKRFNTELHEATASFTKDKKTVYFTRSSIQHGKIIGDKHQVVRLQIFKSTKKKGRWTKPERIDICSKEFSVAHPALNATDRKMYFVSDMPGGYGKSDIYVVPINADGSFGKYQNLGPQINTPGRESFPYVGNSGWLYFSSDGHLGLGGMDIFKWHTIRKKELIHLGVTINSPQDDINFIIKEEDQTGYFASNRSGDDDIFSFKRIKVVPKKKQIQILVKTKHGVLVNNVVVKLFNSALKDTLLYKTNNRGAILVEEMPFTEFTYIGESEYERINSTYRVSNKDSQVWEIQHPNSAFKIGEDITQQLQLDKVYFRKNSSYLDHEKIAADVARLMKILHYYPTLKIEIRAHTDSRGDKAYNLWLSQRRAERIRNYFIAFGIPANRLAARGLGEEHLLVPCEDGLCSEKEHRMNRRTEFIVIKN